MGARQASSRAAILAESLGGERLGARKEARFRGWGGPEESGRAGPRAVASGQAAAAEAERAARGCGRRGELLPRPLTPSAELESGRGGVRGAGPGGELLRVRPERTRGARVRRSRELCGGAAGVEAAEGCMSGARAARRAATVRSGPCWSRRREEASEEPGKREEGAPIGTGEQPGAPLGAAGLGTGRPAAAGGERGKHAAAAAPLLLFRCSLRRERLWRKISKLAWIVS